MPQITTSKALSNMSQMLGNRLDEADESFSTFFPFCYDKKRGEKDVIHFMVIQTKSRIRIQENLRPDLGMYIELGNEAWHDLFFGGAVEKSVKKSGGCGVPWPGWVNLITTK